MKLKFFTRNIENKIPFFCSLCRTIVYDKKTTAWVLLSSKFKENLFNNQKYYKITIFSKLTKLKLSFKLFFKLLKFLIKRFLYYFKKVKVKILILKNWKKSSFTRSWKHKILLFWVLVRIKKFFIAQRTPNLSYFAEECKSMTYGIRKIWNSKVLKNPSLENVKISVFKVLKKSQMKTIHNDKETIFFSGWGPQPKK